MLVCWRIWWVGSRGWSGVDRAGRVLARLVKAVLERGLAEELTGHLGYAKADPAGRGSPNSPNGTTSKTVASEVGDIGLETPGTGRTRRTISRPPEVRAPRGEKAPGGDLERRGQDPRPSSGEGVRGRLRCQAPQGRR
ncbi:hypothetical protein GCM10023317_85210 [Actinopolymorpha pittospori]